MADLSMIDIEQVIYSLQCGSSRLKRTANTRGGNLTGPCPKCYGNDRFYVLPEAEDTSGSRRGKWACRNCHPKEGDAVDLLVHMEGITQAQAFARLKEMYPELSTTTKMVLESKVDRIRPLSETAVPPSEQWQRRAGQMIELTIKWLWSDKGQLGREYLLSRGITEETMRAAQVGYIPQDAYDDPEKWGITGNPIERVFTPCGIVFPYIYKGDIWKLRIRRAAHDVPKDQRYILIPGSANGLYRADDLKVNNPALLFEGEIDALSVAQKIGDLAACVATGSTSHARIDQWKTRLALASQVLLCFDSDSAGGEAITYWSKRLGEIATHLPVVDGYKDANDMLIAGEDLHAWVTTKLVTPNGTNSTESQCVSESQVPQTFLAMSRPSSEKASDWKKSLRHNELGLAMTCSQCSNEAVWYGSGVTPYCDIHWPGERREVRG